MLSSTSFAACNFVAWTTESTWSSQYRMKRSTRKINRSTSRNASLGFWLRIYLDLGVLSMGSGF